MNMTHTVYVKLDEITELTHKDILLKDVCPGLLPGSEYTE